MAKEIRRVSKTVYNKYVGSDYPIGTDNLNPRYDTQLETQVNKIINEVHNRIVKAYARANVKYDDSFDFDNPSVEGLNNDLDNLIKKLSKNPLVDLADNGFAIGPLIGSKALGALTNPICLDCNGVATVEQLRQGDFADNQNLNDLDGDLSNSGNGEDGAKDDNTPFTIKYVTEHSSNWTNTNPTTYTTASCNKENPIILVDAVPDKGWFFKGWFLDSTYNQKIKNNRFEGVGSGVTIYAKYVDDSEDKKNDEYTGKDPISDFPDGPDPDGCDIQELQWLKIILAIVTIVQILVKIVGTVLGIIVPLVNIVKEAQLAWINPPLMASLIQRVSQKLMAIVFSIIGVLLMKLWSLLNFDCISASASRTLAQINQVMAGINDIVASVDACALEIDNIGGFDWKSIVDNLNDQVEQLKDAWSPEKFSKDIETALAGVGKEWAETFTDPSKLYSNAVPKEIRDQVEGILCAYNEGKQNVMSTVDTIKSMVDRYSKPEQKPVGTETAAV